MFSIETIFFLVALSIFSFFLTFLVRKWAIRKSILDHPNERSSHTIPTPRGGGIAIAVTWFAGLIYYKYTNRLDTQLFYALLCGLPLSLTGLLDDVFRLKSGARFLVQFLSAALALYFLSGLHLLSIGNIQFSNVWILTPLALVAIIWLTNLFNFLDGIDGYISTEVIFISVASFVLFHLSIALLLAAAVAGFLFWNWPKAKIFMGDVGSTLLGFNIGVFTVYFQNEQKISIIVMLILTSVFWFDATITLIRRFRNREKLSVAHRKHAYQRIVQAGFSHRKTVIWAGLLNLIGFGLAFLAITYKEWDWAFLIINLSVLSIVMAYIDKKKAFEYNL